VYEKSIAFYRNAFTKCVTDEISTQDIYLNN